MTFSEPVADRMRGAFKQLNRFMVLIFRLGAGWLLSAWPPVTGRILVLMHHGRKSGTLYRTPLNFAEVDGDLHIIAGFGPRTDWYRNLIQQGDTEVWLPKGRWRVIPEDVSDSPARLHLLRQVLIGSGVAAYGFGVPPTLPDDRLDEMTRDYRVVRLRRLEPEDGPGGPNDLVWVWPVAAAGALLLRVVWPRRP
jgi:deazaflavin-dependent oxidoreductase (nitroreductase family)